ncbi:RNA polymerase sigma factor [bacterium]|nr:RNA polymerase sigma factor [bacterium]
MAVHRLAGVVQTLGRRLTPDDPGDGDLLGRFVENRDEAAFAALLQRHGPMVWSVCRRVVGHQQDAEDAFQAVFLVLARRATAVRPRQMVANWLYGVAHRTALKAKVMAARRHARERPVPDLPETEARQPERRGGLDQLIDRELAALPDKYRAAVVLCDLEGKKGKDAARLLQIPEGTLASRLRTGRVMLAKRLTRKGITLSGGALAAVLSEPGATASVPVGLAPATTRAAARTGNRTPAAGVVSANVAALTEGVMTAMVLTKFKMAMAGVLVVGLIVLGGAGARHAAGGPPVRGAEGEREAVAIRPPLPAASNDGDAAAKKAAVPADQGAAEVCYPVADLVIPVPDLDALSSKTGEAKTTEDWLIRKVTRTVAPDSWEAVGGTGTIRYSPRDRTLVVSNSARVQGRVRYLLETMRRVQDVQVAVEVRVVSLDSAGLRGLNGLFPQLRAGGRTVLNDAEAFALLRRAEDGAGTKVSQGPKITAFPGQRVHFSLDLGKEWSGVRKADVGFGTLVAADLRRLQLEVKAAVGPVDFSGTSWTEDGATLAWIERHGGGYLMLVVTPRIIISLPDEAGTSGTAPSGRPIRTAPRGGE